MLILPSSPLSRVHDRFSLTENETDNPVPTWLIIAAVLSEQGSLQTASQLIDILDTISVTLRGFADSNYVGLKQFLLDHWDTEHLLAHTWPKCVELALEMPTLFPSGMLEPLLTRNNPTARYSHRQTACLVVHQFLCTLPRPSWMQSDGSPDLHIWYGDNQPHPLAVHAYLTALFTFFDRIAASPPSEDKFVSFTLFSAASSPSIIPDEALFKPLAIHQLPRPSTHPSLLALPNGASTI